MGSWDVYKRQVYNHYKRLESGAKEDDVELAKSNILLIGPTGSGKTCLLYTSDAADERSSVDLGGRRIIKKKKQNSSRGVTTYEYKASTATL